jgi:uncharacterized protein YlxP (DUF503 family)
VNVRLLTVNFHLGGCRSLKEKRQRLKGLKDRFGRSPNVAVCESDYQDVHQRAQWSFVATAASGDVAERALGEILRSLQLSGIDAEMVGVEQETLLP